MAYSTAVGGGAGDVQPGPGGPIPAPQSPDVIPAPPATPEDRPEDWVDPVADPNVA